MARGIAWIEDVLACVALASFSIAVLIGVISRYFLNCPLSWTYEASLIAFAWLLFLGAAICARENGHVLIDLIMPAHGTPTYKWSEAFAALMAALVSLILAWVSCNYTIGAAPMVTPIFRFSSAIYNAAAPIGFLLITIHMGVLFVQALAGQDVGGHQEKGL